jgi:fido (protein-threonine AMPylation protein)
MKAVVASLQADIAEVEKTGMIDPFMLAAKYCDRFVNIHPFKDGNGRMCRLILNAILVKYAGVIVVLGEKGGERDEYLQIAVESIKVGGHPGQLGGKVLDIARGTLWRMKATLERRMQEKKKF